MKTKSLFLRVFLKMSVLRQNLSICYLKKENNTRIILIGKNIYKTILFSWKFSKNILFCRIRNMIVKKEKGGWHLWHERSSFQKQLLLDKNVFFFLQREWIHIFLRIIRYIWIHLVKNRKQQLRFAKKHRPHGKFPCISKLSYSVFFYYFVQNKNDYKIRIKRLWQDQAEIIHHAILCTSFFSS